MKHHLQRTELKGSHLWVVLYVDGIVFGEIKKRFTFREVGNKTGVKPLGLVAEPDNGCARVAVGFYVSMFNNEFVIVIV